MMNYEEFKEAVERELKSYLPPQYQNSVLRTKKIAKVNREMDGIILSTGNKVGTTVYIDEMFDHYVDTKDFESVMENTASSMVRNLENVPEFPAINAENIKNNVVFQLVNTFQNEQLLSNVPHREMMDLSVVYRWFVREDLDGMASATITNSLAQNIGISEEELFRLASENTMRISPPHIFPMNEILIDLLVADGMQKDLAENLVRDSSVPMYVITNQQKINGAASILFDDALQELSEKIGSDMYLMPSSIHECIAVPSYFGEPEELAAMVNEINLSQVSLQDRLSNQVYHYERNSHKLSMATDTPNKSLEGFKMMVEPQKDWSIGKGR